MAHNISKKNITLIGAIAISLFLLGLFLWQTQIFLNPLVLMILSLFILFPFRRSSYLVKRLIIIVSVLFLIWLLSGIGYALLPFLISFLIAYLFDPSVTYLASKKIPRWLSSLVIMAVFVGIVSLVAIYVFPLVYTQLDDAIKKISSLVTSISKDLDSRKVYRFFANLGLPKDTLRTAIREDLIPKLQNIFTDILTALLSLVTKLTALATQLINAVLIPILSFYLLKDFARLKDLISSILERKDKKLLNNLKRISRILKAYIGWQITAAIFVGTVCSIVFSLFGVPYPIVLGILCGFLNPIPYLGLIGSLIICNVAMVIINADNLTTQIIIISSTIGILHFINSYFLEPNIAGRMVGLHPVILIASLFVFSGLFGFIGLLIAVPVTAILMMFFKDWSDKTLSSDSI